MQLCKMSSYLFSIYSIELCLSYLMGAKTNGQVTENYYIFFNVLILMTTKRNTPERNLYSTPCRILRKQSQGNYKIIPAVEKGQMGPLKAYSRPTSCFSRINYSFVILTDVCLTCLKASSDRSAMSS